MKEIEIQFGVGVSAVCSGPVTIAIAYSFTGITYLGAKAGDPGGPVGTGAQHHIQLSFLLLHFIVLGGHTGHKSYFS